MVSNFRFTEQFNCCPNVLNQKYMECNNIFPYENKTGNQVKQSTYKNAEKYHMIFFLLKVMVNNSTNINRTNNESPLTLNHCT
jgi:hypothetical protein